MKKLITLALVCLLVTMTVFAAGGKEPAKVSGEKVIKKTFVAGIDTMPTIFNPSRNDSPVLNDLVYNTLIHYDKVSAKIEPGLATAWNWIGDDCTVLHLDLRKGVTFHNGNPFTAEDVEYSLENCANTNIATYYDYSVINNDHSIDIYLKAGNADFISVLTNTLYAGIINKKSSEADPNNGSAYGTGPWMIDLKSTIAGDTIQLVRNDNYWGKVAPSEFITLRYIKSDSSRLIALQNNEIQAMMTVGPTDVKIVKGDSRLEYRTGAGVGPAKLYYISFNMKNGALKDNLYLRQAIARVMNRENIIALSGDEGAVESDGIFWGFDTAYRASLAETTVDLSYNVEEAKKLVEKARVAAGGKLPTIHLLGNTQKAINMTMCLEIQQACKEIGLTVVIDESDSAGVNARTHYDNPQFDMIQYNVPLESWASAANRMFVPKSLNNRSIMDIDYVTERLMKASASGDDLLRAQYYKEVQIYIHDNAIYIPAYYGSRDGAERVGTQGIVWTNDGYPEFKYAYYEE